MSGKNILGYLIQFAIAALIFTLVAAKFGILITAGIFGAAIAITALLILGIDLSMDTRR